MQNNQEKIPSWLPIAPWLFICIWSAGYATAGVALRYTEPLTLLALRFGITFVVLTPIIAIVRPQLPNKQTLVTIFHITIFVQLTHFGCVYLGLHLGASAAIMGLLAASQPILITIATSLVQKQLPPKRIWLGLFLGCIGAAWVLFAKGNINQGILLGSILGFLAVVGISCGSIIENKYKPVCHPALNFWLQYGISTVLVVPFAYMFTPLSLSTHIEFITAIAYLVFGNAIIGIYLLLTIMRYSQVASVSSIMFLVPAISAFFAWLLLDEMLPLIAWPGIIIAGVGVILVLQNNSKKNVVG